MLRYPRQPDCARNFDAGTGVFLFEWLADRDAITAAESRLAKLDAIQNPEYRVGLLFEAASLAKDSGDHEGLTFAFNLMRALMRQLLDSIPARYRVAFNERRQIAKIQHFIIRIAEEVEMPNQPRAGVEEQERWNRLLAVTKQLASERDIEKLLRFIMDSAVVLCGAERGFLVLVAPEAPEGLSVRVARNIDQENIRRTRLKISMGIARRVITEQESVLTIDAMEDERYREQVSVHDLKLRSVLCLPMVVRGESVGAIYLDNRFRRSVFTNDDVEQMQAFADQAALALDNAQLLQQMEQTRAEPVESQRQILSLNEQLQEQLAAQTLELQTTQRVLMEQQRQLGVKHQYSNIIGSSDAMRAVFRIIDRLLDNAVPVLIEGESGTGKELVARAIHFNGSRRDEPFVAVNCAAIPTNLIESELFGHVRGAFTGATADRQGLFETADKGTLLLDELGELPLEMQVKLLRVLQSGEVQKVGSSHSRSVDVRIIAATNRRLKDEIEQGRFREDLYYRLAVIPITLPALRDRRDDIPLLAAHFMTQHTAQGIGEAKEIEAKAFKRLMRYDWPGNIRQLEMVLKNAALFCDGHELSIGDFSAFPEIMNAGVATSKEHSLSGLSLAEIEKAAIRQALKDTKGNKKRAAEQLGIDRRTLYNKLAAYEIVIERQLKVR